MKEKLMLIAGCSHAAGSEIDGNEDSVYNRANSFGNQLANRLCLKPINTAEPSSTNPTIARSVLQWFKDEYDENTMEVFVLVSWTDSIRMECPWYRQTPHYENSPYSDYFATYGQYFLRVNANWEGTYEMERRAIAQYHQFMANCESHIEIISLNLVLQLQYFFNSKNINYLMTNSGHMVNKKNFNNEFYIDSIDQRRYLNMLNNDESFMIKYKNLGYENPNSKYFHHGLQPHTLYAQELLKFMESQDVYNTLVQESSQRVQVPQAH